MQIVWDDPQFKLLLRKIYEERGVDLRDYRAKCLARRISTRLNARKVDSILAYIEILNREPDEYKKLLNAVTINVTEFFRDHTVWSALEKDILPMIIDDKTKRSQKFIRCWSAGTSHGEETYSMSILFHEILGSRINDFVIRVHGTDIDKACIEQAQLGEYLPLAMKGINTERLSKYFTFNGTSYIINDAVRLITKFIQHNLVSDAPLKHMDLVVCRNVLIYFSRELQADIYDKFHESLNTDGILAIGKTENIWGRALRLFKPVDSKERIYQKI